MAERGDYTRRATVDHAKTYERFLSLTKYSIVIVVLILVAMALFLL
jgi:hypothetical protein